MARDLHHHDPRFPEVDEIIPVSHGGSPLTRENTRLLHRLCNQQRGADRPARSASAPFRPQITASRGWGPSQG
ncbi:HNH endonuclease [Rathayibacter sp. AY1D1]|uniref:HNH endonuclease n=1 Tax=Rathayibacter sp. AY1D1 TaxID=2080542 RepID=UPI0011B04EF2